MVLQLVSALTTVPPPSEFFSGALITFATEIQVCQNYATSAAPAKITRKGFKRDQINLQYCCVFFAEGS